MSDEYSEKQEEILSEEIQDELGGPPPDDEIEKLTRKIDQLQLELDNANAERLRAIADFQNFRRRNQQDMAAFRQLATENFVSELLPVLDNFERTVEHLNAGVDPEKMLAGVGAVERQLRSVLESQNVKRIPTIGEPFDPEFHEAVGMEASEEHDDDIVTAELEPGYKIGSKVIRPARVKVAKNG